MELIVKISVLAVVAAVLCVLLREHAKPTAMLLSLLACAGILLLGMQVFAPVLTVMEQMERLSGLSGDVIAPMLKVAGIGMLTQIASGVCVDAGENALAKAVEMSGSILAIYLSLPLLSSLLTMMEKLLGGQA